MHIEKYLISKFNNLRNSNWVSKFLNIFVKTLQKSYRNSETYHSRKRFCAINMSFIIDLKSALEL